MVLVGILVIPSASGIGIIPSAFILDPSDGRTGGGHERDGQGPPPPPPPPFPSSHPHHPPPTPQTPGPTPIPTPPTRRRATICYASPAYAAYRAMRSHASYCLTVPLPRRATSGYTFHAAAISPFSQPFCPTEHHRVYLPALHCSAAACLPPAYYPRYFDAALPPVTAPTCRCHSGRWTERAVAYCQRRAITTWPTCLCLHDVACHTYSRALLPTHFSHSRISIFSRFSIYIHAPHLPLDARYAFFTVVLWFVPYAYIWLPPNICSAAPLPPLAAPHARRLHYCRAYLPPAYAGLPVTLSYTVAFGAVTYAGATGIALMDGGYVHLTITTA